MSFSLQDSVPVYSAADVGGIIAALLHARQSRIPLRDDIFKEQFKSIVQRDLNKAQKIFAVTFAYKRGKHTSMLLER